MKKLLAIVALAIFIGGISAPVIAAHNSAITLISLADEDPKKKEKKATKKSATKKSEAKSENDCTNTKKECESAEKKPCSKECGGKG